MTARLISFHEGRSPSRDALIADLTIARMALRDLANVRYTIHEQNTYATALGAVTSVLQALKERAE